MNDERLKSYLQERLGGYSQPVEDSLWSSVSRAAFPENKRRRLPLAIAAVISLGLLLFIDRAAIDEVSNMASDIQPEQTQQPVKESAGEIPVEEQLPIGITEQPKRVIAPKEEVPEEPAVEVPVSDEPGEQNPDKDEQKNHKPEPSANGTRQQGGSVYYPTFPTERKNKGDRGLSVILAFNGTTDVSDTGITETAPPGYGGPEPIIKEMKNPEYDFPVSFTVAVRKGLTDRFAIESGLTYTYLHTRDYASQADIRLHNLGIPVKAVVTLFDHPRLSVYTSAGGMVERQVSGRLKQRETRMNLKNNSFQWSVAAAAGLNFKIADRFGLFAEPGVSYFFDDGSIIPTIRKERPFNFNLQVGLRFNFE